MGLKREGLEYVAELFFYFFEFVLHLYHQFLYLYVVGFRPDSVDFAAHFLCDECQLLAVAFVGVHGLAEVVDVFGEADFFFGDVVFFEIVDKFLCENSIAYNRRKSREATKNSYNRAVLTYFVLIINQSNK